MCVFDYYNNQAYSYIRCQFFVVSGTNCYLGHFGYETAELASTVAAPLELKTGEFLASRTFRSVIYSIFYIMPKMTYFSDALVVESFVNTKFPLTWASNGVRVRKFIYKSLSGLLYDGVLCSSLCFMDSFSTPACHFWMLDSATCYLASPFESTSTSLVAALTVHFNESKYTSFRFNIFECVIIFVLDA
jgi:hypothetical protein